MGIRTSGTQSSPPHTASCGSLLWLRMVEAERWSRTIAENPPPSRSDRNDRERPRDGPGNRQTTYHHPAEHPCDSSGGRAAPGHALALHLWPGALPEPPRESGGDTHPRSCELPGAPLVRRPSRSPCPALRITGGTPLREAPAARKALPRYALLPVTPCSAPSPEPHLAHDGALLRPASPCPALPVVAQRDVRTPDRIAGVRVAL